MAAPRRITDAQKRRIRALHKKGLGRNAIAKEVGVSLDTVTRVCTAAGLSFDRSKTKAAVEARKIDLRAKRQEALEWLYERVAANRERLDADGYSYRITLPGGRDESSYSTIVVDDDPPSADERNHMQVITGYLTAAVKLEQVDGDSTVSQAASIVTRIADAFGINDG